MRGKALVSSRVGIFYLAVVIQLVRIAPCMGYSSHHATVEISNKLGVQLYRFLSREDGNVLFSPLGMTLALGAMRVGARGSIATEIDQVTQWNYRTIHRQLKSLRSQVTVRRIDDIHLKIRNALIGRHVLGLRAKYRKVIRYYGAKTLPMTWTELLEYFNTRVHSKTKQSIEKGPKIFFINDVKLDAVWEIPFTVFTKSPFYIPRQKDVPDNVVQAHYVGFVSDEHQLNYFDDKENLCQVIELNYGKSGRLGDMWDPRYNPADISMVIALPNKDNPLQNLENHVTIDVINKWVSRMKPTNIDVSIPKFNISRFINASLLFENVGVLDLKAADQRNQLMVRSIWQEVNLAVTETGTSTEDPPDVLSIVLLSKSKKTFHAERPFLFLVRDKVTGAILLAGRVINPIQ